MSENVTYITAEGKSDIERELEMLLTVKRPELAVRLKEAVAMGDLKENADYHDTREQLSLLDARIQRLEQILRTAVIIEATGETDIVRIGSTVTIREEGTKEDETYTIVGAAEANPREGRISQESPIGAALLNKKKKDKVIVKAPGGETTFIIMKIK